MGQNWYVRLGEREVGPLTSRELHLLSNEGALAPTNPVSLDGRKWFPASKVLGLFPEGRGSARTSVETTDDFDDFEAVDDIPATRVLDPIDQKRGWESQPARSQLPATRVDLDANPGSDGPEGKTRVETFAGAIVGVETVGPTERGGLARVGIAILKLTWVVVRSIVVATILLGIGTARLVIALVRRRKVSRTRLESRLVAILLGRDEATADLRSRRELSEAFGRYKILRTLGKGGMGTVYLALDTQLGRQVALKVPHFKPDDGPEVLERFDREARSAAMLDHPNVCPIFDVGTIDGTPYASMAFIEGRPLADLVDLDKRLTEREAASLVRKVAIAMAEAHAKGIIHRDLKPANIMMNPRREPIIMDFGLARGVGSGDSKLTKDGAIVGTPAYMSPEQVGGGLAGIGASCDIYSLGVVLYELLTGRLPFEGPVVAVLGQILSSEPKPPSFHRPEVDHQLEAICRKAMARSVADRFGSMADLARSLTKYLKAHPQDDGSDDGDDVLSWSEFFALPPRAAEGAGSVATSAGLSPSWMLRGLAAGFVLLAGTIGYLAWSFRESLVELTTRNRSAIVDAKESAGPVTTTVINQSIVSNSTVNVTLANYQVNQTVVNVTYLYFLDGKPIDAADLARPLAITPGEHTVEARTQEGKSQFLTFAVEKGDESKTVDVRKAPVDASDDAKTQIDGLLDDDAGVRKLAAEQLGKMNDSTSIPALMNRIADDRWYDSGYTNVPSDPEGGGKLAALDALRIVASTRVKTALIRATASLDGRVRLWSLETLANDPTNSKNPEVIAAVIALLNDKDDDVNRAKNDKNIRRRSAEILQSWKAVSAIPALVERVADDVWLDLNYTNVPPDPVGGGKLAALDALRSLAPDRVIAALIRASQSSDGRIRLWSLETLGSDPSGVKNSAVVAAVIVLLKDSDDDIHRARDDKNIRRRAAEILQSWKAEAAIPALIDRVADDVWLDSGYTNIPTDPVGGGKGAALAALRALAPSQVSAALQRARKSPKAPVRKWALEQMGPKP